MDTKVEGQSVSPNDAKPNVGSSHFLPLSCKGVKCMVKGCQNLSTHKVGEENIWCNMDGDWNDEKEKHKEFNMRHNLTSYLCNDHFDLIMSREENVSMVDNRFEGRSL